MKRRGFLGLLGGAAVAGPSAAKQAITQVMPVSGGSGIIGALTAHSYADGIAPPSLGRSGGILAGVDRMLKLKRMIAGEEEPEFDLYEVFHAKRAFIEHAVNALHSVSASQKLRIMAREAARLERERLKASWMRELLGLERMDP